MTTDSMSRREPLALGTVALYGLIAIVGSVVVNLLIRFVGMRLVTVNENFMPLNEPMPTVIFTAGLVLIAVVVFAVVDRTSSNSVRLYNIIALVALIISILPDIGLLFAGADSPMGDPTLGAVIILILMHIAAYAVTVYSLTVLAYRK